MSTKFSAALLTNHILQDIAHTMMEDIMDGDITAMLIDEQEISTARIITREDMVMAGKPWVNALFKQIDDSVELNWQVNDGDFVSANEALLILKGNSRSLLTGERIALNFIQTMAAVATKVNRYAKLIEDLPTQLLDTRKTIPGLRMAQKYAVLQGGGYNHRVGLYDQFLIKENHIMACGGIKQAIAKAKQLKPNLPVEIEIENFEQLEQALNAGADIIMLDNFSTEEMQKAVEIVNGQCKLEASGDITDKNLREVALTGVDYISMGALTKHVQAIDLSMRFLDK